MVKFITTLNIFQSHLQQILLSCIRMIERAMGLSPQQRESFYFMFFVKYIEIADHFSSQEQPGTESQLKFAIYKGIQIFNQTRQPVPVKFVNGQAAVQKVQLSFFLKDYNVNRKVDFVVKLLKIVNDSDELVDQLTVETHKYIDTYLNRLEEQGIFGPYKVTYVIFTDKTRHDLQKIVKAYKQESEGRSIPMNIDKQETTKQTAKNPIQSKLSTPKWRSIEKEQSGQSRGTQQKQQGQNSNEKSGVNQSGAKSEGSKILFNEQVRYNDDPKEAENILQHVESNIEQQQQKPETQMTAQVPTKNIAAQSIQHKSQYSNIVENTDQEHRQQFVEQEDEPLQRVTLTYQNQEQPMQGDQQHDRQYNQLGIQGQKSLPQLQQEIENKMKNQQYHQQLLEKLDDQYQEQENQYIQYSMPQSKLEEDAADRNIEQQNIQGIQNFKSEPPQKFNEETGQWEAIGEVAHQNASQNWLTASKQKTNEDAVSQIVENINFSNPPKYYDRNKQYYQPPKEEIHQIPHRPALSTPRDMEEELLPNIPEQQGQQLKQSGAQFGGFKEEPKFQDIDLTANIQNQQKVYQKEKTLKQNKQLVIKQNQEKHKLHVKPSVSLKYSDQTPQESESPLIGLHKVQVQKVEQKHSDFKLTLKILIVIIITGMILYFLFRPTHTSQNKITGPKSHHNVKTKLKKVEKNQKVTKSRLQSKTKEGTKKKKNK